MKKLTLTAGLIASMLSANAQDTLCTYFKDKNVFHFDYHQDTILYVEIQKDKYYHINLKYGFKLIGKEIRGDIYKPLQVSPPLLNTDPVDLRNSPDYTLLYGVRVDKCFVGIYYDDNRRKGRSWDIELKNNMFIMFPSTNMYHITNNQPDSLNFVQTITYELA